MALEGPSHVQAFTDSSEKTLLDGDDDFLLDDGDELLLVLYVLSLQRAELVLAYKYCCISSVLAAVHALVDAAAAAAAAGTWKQN